MAKKSVLLILEALAKNGSAEDVLSNRDPDTAVRGKDGIYRQPGPPSMGRVVRRVTMRIDIDGLAQAFTAIIEILVRSFGRELLKHFDRRHERRMLAHDDFVACLEDAQIGTFLGMLDEGAREMAIEELAERIERMLKRRKIARMPKLHDMSQLDIAAMFSTLWPSHGAPARA